MTPGQPRHARRRQNTISHGFPDYLPWIEGIRYLMTGQPLMPRQPWPYYRDEHQVWL